MRLHRARAATTGALLATLVIASMASPAAAGAPPYGYGPHDANTGLHWILDNRGPGPETPSVTCTYRPDGELDRMTIHQPVIFRYKGGPNPQLVGWQAKIQWADEPFDDWNAYAQTSTSKGSASGRYPADFLPKTYDFPANVEQHDAYRVLFRLSWYKLNGTTVDGRASHRNAWFRVVYDGDVYSHFEYCYSQIQQAVAAPVPPFGEGVHEGKRGLHWILDTLGPYPEYPAVTCEYGANGKLARIRIRRPIVFARDKGPGVNQQDVAWKAVVQQTPLNSGDEAWSFLDETPTSRVRATDRAWADFLPRTVELEELDGIVAVRVVYRLTWYKGSANTVAGRAAHWPFWNGETRSGGGHGWRQELCYSELVT